MGYNKLKRYFLRASHWTLFYLITLSGLLFFSYFSYFVYHNTLNKHRQQHENIVNIMASSTHSQLIQYEILLNIMGNLLLKNNNYKDKQKSRDIFVQMLHQDKAITAFGLVSESGFFEIVNTNIETNGLPNLLKEEEQKYYFQRSLQSKNMVVGNPHYFKPIKKWIIPLRKAIRDNNGKVLMVMTIGVLIDEFAGLYTKKSLLYKDQIVGIFRPQDRRRLLLLKKNSISNDHYYNVPIDQKTIDNFNNSVKKTYTIPLSQLKKEEQTFSTIFFNVLSNAEYHVSTKNNKQYDFMVASMFPTRIVYSEFVSRFSYSFIIYIVLNALLYFYFKLLEENQKRTLTLKDQDIKKNKKLYQELIESIGSSYIIYSTDMQGKIQYISPSAEKYFGKIPDEIVGNNWSSIATWIQQPLLAQKVVGENDINKQHQHYQTSFTRDNNKITFEIQERVVLEEHNSKSIIHGIMKDISTDIENQKRLKEAKDAADISNKTKSEFLANMSHEIRTPMNAILGFSEILSYCSLGEKEHQYVSTIQKSTEGLITIINDILDLSKIEANKLKVNPTTSNIRELIQELQFIFEPKMNKKELQWECIIDDKLPHWLLFDEIRIRQILFNIIGNAIKFTHKGKITISIFQERNTDKYLDLNIHIKDTGIGIKKKHQTLIFEPFEQQKQENFHNYEGTGLGLSICKRLTELMSGTIELESKPNIGSTFKLKFNNVEIIQKTHKKSNSTTKLNYNFNKASVLLVDDEKTNINLIKEFFHKTALNFIEAYNGQEALQVLQENTPDLIIMDIKMPILNGIDATKQIRETKEFKTIPIISLSTPTYSDTLNQDNLSMLFDNNLTKPISLEKLKNSFAQFLKHDVLTIHSTQKQSDLLKNVVITDSLKKSLDVALSSGNPDDCNSLILELKKIENKTESIEKIIKTLQESLNSLDLITLEALLSELKTNIYRKKNGL